MSWDAVVFDFEDTLVDLSRGRPRKGPPAYYSGARGMPAVRDRDGRPVLEALTRLIEKGTPVAVITASPEPAMRRWFSEQHFTLPVVVIGFHDTVLHRPSPHPLLEALHQLGQVPSPRVLSVGDSGDDTEAARRAGLTPATVRSFVPLSEPPDLFLPSVDSFFDDSRVLRLAGDTCDGSGVTLEADLGGHAVRAGGRLRHQPRSRLGELLEQARAGTWTEDLVRLARRLVDDALVVAGLSEAVLTWVPVHAGREDHMKGLMANLKAATGLPTTRLLRFRNDPGSQTGRGRAERAAAMEGTMDLRSQVDLAGRHVFVIDDVRDTGATLKEAARVLTAAGAASVTGLALAQQEHRNSEVYARYTEPSPGWVAGMPRVRPALGRAADAQAGEVADETLESAAASSAAASSAAPAATPAATPAAGLAAPAAAPERRPPPAPAPPRPTPAPGPAARRPAGGTGARPGAPRPLEGPRPISKPAPAAASRVEAEAAASSWPSLLDGAAAAETAPAKAPAQPSRVGQPRAVPVAEVFRDPVAIKARFPRAYQRWEPEEDELLQRLFSEGRPVAAMMDALGRQRKSIESRIRKLQLYVVPEADAEREADGSAAPEAATPPAPPAVEAAPVEEPVPFVPPEAVKQRYPRAYQRWEPEEDELLARLFAEKRSLAELCEALGRQAKAVETRIRRLEIDVPEEELGAE